MKINNIYDLFSLAQCILEKFNFGVFDNYLHAAFREVVIDTLGVTIPYMVKKSLTRSANNIVFGDLVYGSKPQENN